MDEPSDVLDELVGPARAGDRGAVERMLALIGPLVVRYCRARPGWTDRSSVSTDDVAQEVCVAVLAALPGYREQGRPFVAFVYGITAHKVIDAHRGVTRSRCEPVAEVPEAMDVGEGPERRALRGELSAQLARLLDALPGKQREVLVLRVVVGLSARETADAVGSTPATVRVTQHRALVGLRQVLREQAVARAGGGLGG